jgi:hypothetical protein
MARFDKNDTSRFLKAKATRFRELADATAPSVAAELLNLADELDAFAAAIQNQTKPR